MEGEAVVVKEGVEDHKDTNVMVGLAMVRVPLRVIV